MVRAGKKKWTHNDYVKFFKPAKEKQKNEKTQKFMRGCYHSRFIVG